MLLLESSPPYQFKTLESKTGCCIDSPGLNSLGLRWQRSSSESIIISEERPNITGNKFVHLNTANGEKHKDIINALSHPHVDFKTFNGTPLKRATSTTEISTTSLSSPQQSSAPSGVAVTSSFSGRGKTASPKSVRPATDSTEQNKRVKIQGLWNTETTQASFTETGGPPLPSHTAAETINSAHKIGAHSRTKRWARSRGRARSRSRLTRFDILRAASKRSSRHQSRLRNAIIVRKRKRVVARVGVLVVVENSLYRKYLQDNRHDKRLALARLKRYFGMVFAMMDQRFATIKDPALSISVKISGILVAESYQDSSWLDQIVDWGTTQKHGKASVPTDLALKHFSKWVSRQRGLPKYDHAMMFTNYRLSSKQGAGLGGMAYLKAICDTATGNSVSIVAEKGDFQSVKVATHELAHSLGAYHDGYPSARSCSPRDNFIMTPHSSHAESVLKNAYYFSPCSIRDMYDHLRKPIAACVRDEPTVYYDYDLNRQPPGRYYSADAQCKLIFGKKSAFCRVSKQRDMAGIMCGLLWCKDPDKPDSCRTNSYLSALPGTPCSSGKVCHLGECQTNPYKTAEIRIRSSSQKPSSRTYSRLPQRLPQRTPQQTSPRKPQVTARRTPQQTSIRKPQRTPQQTPQRNSQRALVRRPQRTTKLTPQRSPQRAPQTNLQNTSQRIPQRTPQRTPESNPERTPQRNPQQTPQRTSQRNPQRTPQTTQQRTSQRTSNRIPQRTRQRTLQRTIQRTLQRTPQRRPDWRSNAIPSISQRPPRRPTHRSTGTNKRDPAHQRRRSRTRTRQGMRRRARRRRRHRRRCQGDTNQQYCQGLIKINPDGCQRRAIRNYCCSTCRHQRGKHKRRKR